MRAVADLLIIAVVLLNFAALGSSRLSGCIRLVAIQGVLISLVPAALHGLELGMHALLLVVAPLVTKGLVIPWLLLRAMREAEVRREVEPYVGFTASLLIGGALTAAAFRWAARLPPVAGGDAPLLSAVALATVLNGALLMVSRRKAVTQVLGYLVLENGIFLFGQSLATQLPVLVELGVLLDLLVAVFVMGIAIFHINREFDTIAVHELTALRD